jgi:hypothetical protein
MNESDAELAQDLDPDALFCSLVLAPESFPRNRFFLLFEEPRFDAVRKRARRVRGIVEQLLGRGHPKAEIVGEQVMADGQVILAYRVHDLSFERTTALGALEAAALRYALHRAGAGPLGDEDRAMVCGRLRRLGSAQSLLPDELRAELG